MTRRTIRVHAFCGTRMPGRWSNFCWGCNKWLLGGVISVYRDTRKPVRHQQRDF